MHPDVRTLEALYQTTGHEWRRAVPAYMEAKTRYAVFGSFCVFTPDHYIRRQSHSRCFIPWHCADLYHPQRFVDDWLNAKDLVRHLVQWTSLDLELLPPLPIFYPVGDQFLIGTLHLKGEVATRSMSKNHASIEYRGRDQLSYTAKDTLFQWLGANLNFGVKAEDNTLYASLEAESDTVTTRFSVAPGTIKASVTLPTTRLWHGMWELLVDIGVELDATLVQIPPMPKPEVVMEATPDYWERMEIYRMVTITIVSYITGINLAQLSAGDALETLAGFVA